MIPRTPGRQRFVSCALLATTLSLRQRHVTLDLRHGVRLHPVKYMYIARACPRPAQSVPAISLSHTHIAVSLCILSQKQEPCPWTPAFSIARAHNFVTVTHRRGQHTASRRNFLHCCPQAPAITQECRLLPLPPSPFLRMSVLVKSSVLITLLNRSPLLPLLPNHLRSDR